MSEREDYKAMLDSIPCGVCRVALDDNLTILYANKSYYKIYGYNRQTAKERGFTNARFILQEEDYKSIHDTVLQHVEQGDADFQLEYRGTDSSGRLMWLLVRCSYDPGQPGSILCALVDIADRKKMERELRISMEESRIAYQLTDKMMYIYDVEERLLHQPVEAADEFGLAAEVKNAPYSIVESGAIDPESRQDYIDFYEAIIRGEPTGHAAVKKKRKDGSFGWYEAKFSLICDEDGKPKKAVISCEDITKQREKEMSYQKWSQYFKAQEGETIGFYEYNLTKDIFEVNAGDTPPDYLRQLKKYTETVVYIAERFVREEDKEQFYNFFDRDKLLVRYYDGQTKGVLDYRRKREDGSSFWARAITLLLSDPYSDDVWLFMMTLNIDKEKNERLNLRNRAERDGLTGLYNRETFITRVSQVLDTDNEGKCHVLIMLDIDSFKKHNDEYGHPFGDLVIQDTARFIKGFLKKHDICGRMGGDEFMVFLYDVGDGAEVKSRIDMLFHLLQRTYANKGEVSSSMGVSFYPRDGSDFQTLYQKADQALYEAKKEGRGIYRLYCPETYTVL